ncbi:hypothetical protein ACGRHY_28050 [Streptomyces sp. HK10]|uniref:hypothetical protein n=1 Tax=Streptomyces sp. HK10 TaxID=3373255 RepID=UPI0037487D4A
MPVFLAQPSYGPGGPDGQGWNRLSLCAHFDERHQCGLLPTTYATLYESMTGRQGWGDFERCPKLAPGHCPACPVQRGHLEHQGIAWPSGTPLLLVRVCPLPPTPEAMFADPMAGRSMLHLHSWQGDAVDVEADWQTVRNTPGIRLGRAFWDRQGQAFWLVRNNPAAKSATVRSRRYKTHVRHALYGGEGKPRLALLTCHDRCTHSADDLQHLAADLADRSSSHVSASAPVLPRRLPGAPGIDFRQESGRAAIQRHGSTAHLSWDVPDDAIVMTALAAHAVRLTSA